MVQLAKLLIVEGLRPMLFDLVSDPRELVAAELRS